MKNLVDFEHLEESKQKFVNVDNFRDFENFGYIENFAYLVKIKYGKFYEF